MKPSKNLKVSQFHQVVVRLHPERMEALKKSAQQNERTIAAEARLRLNKSLEQGVAI